MAGMAGTRRAWVLCAGCGHARIRHVDKGRGRCCVMDWITTSGEGGRPVTKPAPCPCTTFTARES